MKIAVVGSGISGLGAAYILSKKHEVHLFEAEGRLGGHAHTVSIQEKESSVAMDTGFLVYNHLTYPHFTKFMEELGIHQVDSDMTLSIRAPSGLEWAGTNLRTVFAQKRNIFKKDFLIMLRDILRFHRDADENLRLSRQNDWTLGELAEYRQMSPSFLHWYLLPMTGAIWSMSNSKALEFPAQSFMNFCMNHRLLQVNARPVWKTIGGGSINYVKAVERQLPHVHMNAPVESIARSGDGLVLKAQGQEGRFDKVILATHAPVSHRILNTHFPETAKELAPLRTSANQVVLHQNASVMPQRRKCWSAWNVRAVDHARDEQPVLVSYFLNKLQPLRTRQNYFITLNSKEPLSQVQRTFEYHHPQFDKQALAVQKRLPELQGRDGIYLAGAWTRYGFHEDGLLSAVQVAKALGVETPWKLS